MKNRKRGHMSSPTRRPHAATVGITILIATFLLVGNLVMLGGYAAKPFMEPIGKRLELWANRMVEEEFANAHARFKQAEAKAGTPQEKAAGRGRVAGF